MEELVVYIIQAVFFYLLGALIVNLLLYLFVKNKDSTTDADLDDSIIDQIMKKIHMVYVEKHGDVYYWYDRDSKNFLAQGQDLAEIIQQLRLRFPKEIFFANINGAVHHISAPDWTPRQSEINDKSVS